MILGALNLIDVKDSFSRPPLDFVLTATVIDSELPIELTALKDWVIFVDILPSVAFVEITLIVTILPVVSSLPSIPSPK